MDGEVLVSNNPDTDEALRAALAEQNTATQALIERWIQERPLREGADPLGR